MKIMVTEDMELKANVEELDDMLINNSIETYKHSVRLRALEKRVLVLEEKINGRSN